MTKPFYLSPILNSPYVAPTRHHALSEDGQPLEHPPVDGRRRSKYVTPVPRARKVKGKGEREQQDFGFERAADGQAYNPTPIINEIRGYLEAWRSLPNPNDWGVTPTTQRLLQHWRYHDFQNAKPFFCQVEAVETVIWLTEVARGRRQYAHIFRHLEEANAGANPELFRLALKLATGAGKTTVMAMLIAWQAINAARQPNSSLFSKGFLLIAPGITIKDRLRVLNPADSENYYQTRELVPPELMTDLGKAKIVITNYHAFQRREKLETNKTGRAVLSGWRNEELITKETEGEMLQRACGELLSLKNIVVINDEAHHCYRERPPTEEEMALKGEEKEEAEKNNRAARLWIFGIEALKRKVGVRAVYDLSATPFFLRGSGYEEGTLFPWVVSDFSLVDAIECGIVKLPRVPVSDNAVNAETPVFRNLWNYIGKEMPKKGKGKAGELDPLQLPPKLQTALYALYTHYEKEYEAWERAGIGVPPVFIVVCNNTASSNLVYEWISGWDRDGEGQRQNIHRGHLKLFSNFDQYGNPLPRMNTLLIDSQQVDSGEALDENFRKIAAAEIELFRQEKAAREGAAEADKISDSDLLREVMNTVGRKGRLGERIRCVVSVSMLTEGWDANTVTHILGVRAFGTQLLCEQVIGRGLRRQSYELNPETGLFETEYADILGIPFDFATEPQDVVRKPPKPVTRVFAVRERERLSIRFPRVAGYRIELPDDRISATFTADSRLELTPELVGPCTARLEGLVGEGHDISPDALDEMRPNTVAVHLTKRLVETYFRDPDQPPPYHLYNQIQPITRRWIRDCLAIKGGTKAGMLTYAELADIAAGLIYKAIVHEAGADGEPVVKAMLDPFNPYGNTSHVSFITTKTNLWTTAADKSHVNYVVCDSDWEGEFARVVESHPSTLAYVKNQALGFEVPYRDGSTNRKYLPDFIVLLDDGKGPDDPLQLIVEIKGFKDLNAQIKAETMRALWVPGVNNLKTFGRWAFAEFRDAFAIEEEWEKLMQGFVKVAEPA
ncbi:MAG: restriction endonuclease [Mesorhizobium sp.]|uniref:BPTD_3080 family restriction endonuclease n=1 Tax=Mesorhizobium sp. TaxID=1871066 RepID=UPI000FEA2DCC|nr:DEAD/DEAH box helicase family protein [Mesorhizobium sp.]RWK85299.1 MAG: restriction endonuclease [Mesorhizobium sp.]